MNKILIIFLIGFFLFLSSGRLHAVSAQVLKFQLPTSQAIQSGVPFQAQILINTGGIQTINADAMVVFDPAIITVNTAGFQAGTFYPAYLQKLVEGSLNKYLISGYVRDIGSPKTSSTDTLFATLSLTAKTSGSTQLSFDCVPGSTADSNISQSDSQDVIECPLQPLTVTIGGGGADTTPTPTGGGGGGVQLTPTLTPTPTPTSTPSPSLTPTPKPTVAELKRAGSAEVTLAALGAGIVLTVVGVLLLL